MTLAVSNPAGFVPFTMEDMSVNPKNVYYVVPAVTASGGGRTFVSPFKTMAEALAVVDDGDTIYVYGAIAEAAQTLSKDNVKIIGIGPNPDANAWAEAAKEQAYLLLVTGRDCLLKNIRFRGCRSDAPSQAKGMCLQVSDAYGLVIEDCWFYARAGSSAAIDMPVACDNIRITNCKFMYFNTATYGCAIYGHTYAGNIITSGGVIEGCIFHSNLQHIILRMRQSVIRNNEFAAVGNGPAGGALSATTMINLSGTTAAWNLVTKNLIPGNYSDALYTPGTNDNWTGNFNDDTAEAEVGDNGITLAPPVAD